MKLAASIATLLAFICCYVVIGYPNLTVESRVCVGVTYDTANDPYQMSVDYVFNDLLTVTANTPGYNRFTQSPYLGIPTAYGHASCTTTLSVADCIACIEFAISLNRGDCHGDIGGASGHADCTVAYGNTPI